MNIIMISMKMFTWDSKRKKKKEKKITIHLENYSADINFKCGPNKIKFCFWGSRNGTDH